MFGEILGAVAGSLVSGLVGRKSQKDAAEANAELQREFAQQGVRWRVEDAKAAGIHPLAALGMNPVQASPTYVGDNPLPDLGSIGQNIGRAIDAKRTERERDKARLDAMIETSLQQENMQLQNDLLRAQIRTIQQPGHPPGLPNSAYPIAGQPDSRVIDLPLQRIAGEGLNASKEVGSLPDFNYVRTSSGGLAPVPSRDVKDRIEDMAIPEVMWGWRNNIVPNVDPSALRPGPGWVWNNFRQEYQPVPKLYRRIMDALYPYHTAGGR